MKYERSNNLPDGSSEKRHSYSCSDRPEKQRMNQTPDRRMVGKAPEESKQRQSMAKLQMAELQRRNAVLEQRIEFLGRALSRAYQFAFRDPLTNIPNRRVLADRFDQAISRAARQQHMVALLFIDLDGFKRINDALGHAVGDQLLCEVARRLASCTRKSDTVCRYGGDEFVILIPDCEARTNVEASAQKIRACLESEYRLDNTIIRLTVSIGMALYPIDGKDYKVLMHCSDRTMYMNKAQIQ